MGKPTEHDYLSDDTSINMHTAFMSQDQLESEEGYIAKKLPDMRIDKQGRPWRANPKIATSFPPMSDEQWARIMAK